MKEVLGTLRLFIFTIVATLLIAGNASACSCETYGEPRQDAKEYYRKKFDGAIFTGTISEIKHDPASNSGGITFSELWIEVDKYWLGVRKPDIVVLVPGPNTSCWVDWKIGEKDFFLAANTNGRLYLSMCDHANWGGTFPSSKWSDYTRKTLGPAKSVLKDKAKPQRTQL